MWVRIPYAKPKSRVRAAAGTLAEFLVSMGVRQGSALSLLLFIVSMDAFTRNIQKPTPWSLYMQTTLCSLQNPRTTLSVRRRHGVSLKHGSVSESTSKRPRMEADVNEPATIKVDGNVLQKSDFFKYLGKRSQPMTA